MQATNEEQVILVDENDRAIGLMPKLEAHEKAMAMLKARVSQAEEKSRELEHKLYLAGQRAV